MTTAARPLPPAVFRSALEQIDALRPRDEIEIGPLPAPAKLAPFSHALSATVLGQGDEPEPASGRFILLHDPNGLSAWDGTLRIVIFLTAEIDPELARDSLLAEVAWSWLDECLGGRNAEYSALGGTITATSSTRFGDIVGPSRSDDLEIRASWTPQSESVGAHAGAFFDLLALAAGLPPEGVSAIGFS